MKLELYFSPGSCPRVSIIALEETGAPFETHLVAFMAGEHRRPEFLARNPSGKIPVLLVDGRPIVQTVAILGFLDETFPGAALFPERVHRWRAQSFSQIWCRSVQTCTRSSRAWPFHRS